MSSPPTGTPRRLLTVLLAIVVALLVWRLTTHSIAYVRTGAQMDLAAYWTAGRATAVGLSPYVNHVDRDPPLWDGIAIHRHSRFVYPPLVAELLTPLAQSSYAQAKLGWTLSALLALGVSLLLAWRLAGLAMTPWSGWLIAGLAAGFYPVLALIERGQSDAHLLLLLLGAIALMRRPGWVWLGGALLALAALFKLYLILVVPFLIARRQWRAMAGWSLGALVVTVISLALSGKAVLNDYVTQQLPRIARYGDSGPASTRLPAGVLAGRTAGQPAGFTRIDGERYRVESLRFTINASLVRTELGRATWKAMQRLGLGTAPAHVSAVFFVFGFAAIVVVLWRTPLLAGSRVEGWVDLAWWQVILTAVLLLAPLTWAMGTVWLLPAAPIAWAAWQTAETAHALKTRVSAGLAWVGVLVAALPDPWLGELTIKYLVAEGLVLVGMLGLLRRSSENSGTRRAVAGPRQVV